MMFPIIMIIAGSVLIIAGTVGCVVPVLPGPPVAYLALILVSIAGGWELYRISLLVVLGIVAIAVTILDNVVPVMTSRRAGAGKAGIWGSVIGMLAGMLFFPPFGIIVGAFIGAVAGEAIFGGKGGNPLKAGLGVFTGTLLSTLIKLSTTGIVAFFFVRGAARLLA